MTKNRNFYKPHKTREVKATNRRDRPGTEEGGCKKRNLLLYLQLESSEIQERKCYFYVRKGNRLFQKEYLRPRAWQTSLKCSAQLPGQVCYHFLASEHQKCAFWLKLIKKKSSTLMYFDTVYPSKDDDKNKWYYIYSPSIRLYLVDRDNLIFPCGWIPIFGKMLPPVSGWERLTWVRTLLRYLGRLLRSKEPLCLPLDHITKLYFHITHFELKEGGSIFFWDAGPSRIAHGQTSSLLENGLVRNLELCKISVTLMQDIDTSDA